jgi:hypothetical protein
VLHLQQLHLQQAVRNHMYPHFLLFGLHLLCWLVLKQLLLLLQQKRPGCGSPIALSCSLARPVRL